MKIIFSVLLVFFSLKGITQINKAVTNEEMKALAGNWDGTMVSTVFTEGKNQHSYSTSLAIIDLNDSLEFNFTHSGAVGKVVTEKYALRIYNNGNKLSFDSAQYDITYIRRRGVGLTFYAEFEGYDNFRRADYQYIFIIGPGILNITKGIRYADMVDFSIQKELH